MLDQVLSGRSYSPETIAVMTAAFERVCQSLSERVNGNDDVKASLALAILWHFDKGETNPERLADFALRECTGSDRAETR